MKNLTRHTGTLRILRREPSSRNGNPRYFLSIDGTTCYTAPDSSYGYGVTNYDGRRVEATIGTYYGKPTLNSLKDAD